MYVGVDEVSLFSGGGSGGLSGGALDAGCSLLAPYSAPPPRPSNPSSPQSLLLSSKPSFLSALFLLSSALPLLWCLIHGLLGI